MPWDNDPIISELAHVEPVRLVFPTVYPRASGPLPLSQGIKWREAEIFQIWRKMDGLEAGFLLVHTGGIRR